MCGCVGGGALCPQPPVSKHLLQTVAPTMAAAFFYLGEHLTPTLLLAAIIMAAGCFLAAK